MVAELQLLEVNQIYLKGYFNKERDQPGTNFKIYDSVLETSGSRILPTTSFKVNQSVAFQLPSAEEREGVSPKYLVQKSECC